MRKSIFILLVLLLLTVATPVWAAQSETSTIPGGKPQQADATEQPTDQSAAKFNLEQKIDQWIITLSKNEKFALWKEARWQRFPLGPGTHGWIVLVYHGDREAGYLIVSVSPNGDLQLSEYGTGEYPLFSLSTLYRTMVQHELISLDTTYHQFLEQQEYTVQRLYLSAFEAVWKITKGKNEYYFDGVTGEAFPLDEEMTTQISVHANSDDSDSVHSNSMHHKISETLSLPGFDPFNDLYWVAAQPLAIKTFADLQKKLQKEDKATYTASIFDHNITVAFSVTGYQRWEQGESYVALGQEEGTRYIPFPITNRKGDFY